MTSHERINITQDSREIQMSRDRRTVRTAYGRQVMEGTTLSVNRVVSLSVEHKLVTQIVGETPCFGENEPTLAGRHDEQQAGRRWHALLAKYSTLRSHGADSQHIDTARHCYPGVSQPLQSVMLRGKH